MSTLINGSHSQMLSYLLIKNEVGGACIVFGGGKNYVVVDVYGSMHRNINITERTDKMRLCSRIYYFIVY
jgi:hypothetical protein